MDMEGFGDLVQQAQQLTATMDTGSELPRVERNLFQIRDAAVKMAARAPCAGMESSDIKATLLLGSRGYDVQGVSRKLETLSSTKTFEPLEPIRDTDIQGFLKNERENALLSAIEQVRTNTFDEISRRHWDSMECEWEREKQRLLNSLVDSSGETFNFTAQPDSVLTDSISMQGRSTLDSNELAYSRQVYMYNEQLLTTAVQSNLGNLFSDVAARSDNVNIIELWNVVQHMVDIPDDLLGSVQTHNLATLRMQPNFQTVLVRQALKYLQQSYRKYIEKRVYSNLQQAQLGGVPGTYNLVRSFLNIHLSTGAQGLEDGVVDGHPIWALIYYCIRCGDLGAARQVITQTRQHLGDFSRFFNEYVDSLDKRLSASSEREIRLQYRRAIRNSTDPYKRAVYCVIGQCDPRDDHPDLATSTDDYLWFKLGQVTFDDDETGSTDRLTLTQLQTMLIDEYGESHFNAYSQPYLYFRVLFLTGQFEAAIEFMARMETQRCYAVHVALVLHQRQLLLLPSSTQAPLLSVDSADVRPLRRLNFVRLVMMYTHKFETTDPREALQYYYFFSKMRTAQGENLFMRCVSELVLETREFDMLLGQLQPDGTRRPGAIDRFGVNTQTIIELVALDTENKGQTEDAVKLYDLAQKYDKVYELLNKLLCQVLSHPPSPQSTKDRVRQLALTIAQRYRDQGICDVGEVRSATFHLQLDLMTFFDYYHAGKHDLALQVLQTLKFLPMKVEDVEAKLKTFRQYTDEIRHSLPDILLATMSILLAQYNGIKGSSGNIQNPFAARMLSVACTGDDGGKQSYVVHLRSQAQALIMFAGMIPYRMPGDTNARLVQMEVLMN